MADAKENSCRNRAKNKFLGNGVSDYTDGTGIPLGFDPARGDGKNFLSLIAGYFTTADRFRDR